MDRCLGNAREQYYSSLPCRTSPELSGMMSNENGRAEGNRRQSGSGGEQINHGDGDQEEEVVIETETGRQMEED